MRLVDDQRVVARQPGIALDLGQQDAVGHEFQIGVVADLLVEAHLEADRGAERRAELVGHALGHRARGDAARLGAADHAGHAAAGRQADLRQLRGLAGTGLAGHHHHLVARNQFAQFIGVTAHRQAVVHPRLGPCGGARREGGVAVCQCARERRLGLGVGRVAPAGRLQAPQAALVAAQGLGEIGHPAILPEPHMKTAPSGAVSWINGPAAVRWR